MQSVPYSQQLSFLDIGWLAGLYEGEGTCYSQIARRGPNGAISTSVRVCICMTDRDVIERVQHLFPSPSQISQRKRNPRHKEQFEWRISRRDLVAEFLQMILPLLCERRREQALKVLARATDPNGGLGSGHRNKTHCPNGHEYTRENTRIQARNKGRRCRTCGRLAARRRYAALKAERAERSRAHS